MKIDYEKLDSLVLGMKDELISDIREWIAVPSVQGEALPGKPFGEVVASMLDKALLTAQKYGFETRNVDYYAGDVSMGKGEQTLGILGHLDIVPAGEGWTHAPFGGEIADGKIFGRGTIDNKGPVLCALHAMRAVRDAGIELRDGVRLIMGCDEETGMSDMRYYASKYEMPNYGFSPDASFPVINIEKGGVNVEISMQGAGEDKATLPVYEIYAGERPNVVPAFARAIVGTDKLGFEELKNRIENHAQKVKQTLHVNDIGSGKAEITAEGVLSHGSLPELGVNAASILMLALEDIGADGGAREVLEMINRCVGMEPDGESLGIACHDEISHHLSCNLGIVRWDGINFVATLDMRFPLCTNEVEILGNIVKTVSKFGASVKQTSGHVPHHVPAEHKIVRGLMKVYNELTGQNEQPIAIGGGTYSRMMPNTVAFGPVFPDQVDSCHVADENIEIDRMMEAVRIFAHAIAELASGNIA